jgi:phosphomethylpyrimidine synthase
MTQLEQARQGRVTEAMAAVARAEGLPVEEVRQRVAQGKVVIPANKRRPKRVYQGFGQGLAVKVCASIGTAKDSTAYGEELAKLEVAVEAGAHAVMDLSIGGDLDFMRREVLKRTDLPVGTMPIYQAFTEARLAGGVLNAGPEDMLQVIEKQAAEGVDFMGLHCAMTLKTLEVARRQGRLMDLVSWGGSLLAGWMLYHREENPLYVYFDRILEIAREYDVTLSLADGLRPGCVADSLDRAQVQELVILGELVDRARATGVQIMIKGPGHAPLTHLAPTVQLMKRLCGEAPYFVFGPVVTDVAPGYDHITAAIGAALAGAAGADFICYVTPAEHVAFPDPEDVRQGVMAARVAAHAADLARGTGRGRDWDDAVARARCPWDVAAQRKLAMDPARLVCSKGHMEGTAGCRSCRSGCAMRVVADFFGRKEQDYC